MVHLEANANGYAGRRQLLRYAFLDNTTNRVAIAVAFGVVGLIIVGLSIWACITKCGRAKSSSVAPTDVKGDAEQGWKAGVADKPDKPHVMDGWPPPNKPPAPPPWEEEEGQLPPGLMLSPYIPPSFQAIVSNPRAAGAPPFERLLLISSRIVKPAEAAAAALPGVAVVVYDYKNFTLQELMRYVKKVLGPQKVTSIGVVAPGSKPGSVGLLEGATTTAEKLATRTELSQFWRVLAGCVAPSALGDGWRIDLLGCRVVEAPAEGAALLRELWKLTAVPFAAADDALNGYMLATFMEEPSSGAVSLISCTVKAMDLYFDRYKLLGLSPPPFLPSAQAQPTIAPGADLSVAAAGLLGLAPLKINTSQGTNGAVAVAAAPLPPGMPPPSALTALTPPMPGSSMAVAAGSGRPMLLAPLPAGTNLAPNIAASAAPAAAAESDIFGHFIAAVKGYALTPDQVFDRYDTNKSGTLTSDEVLQMVVDFVPGASNLDCQHVQAMLEVDGQPDTVTRKEFVDGIAASTAIKAAVKSGADEGEVLQRLHDYLTDNASLLRQIFAESDVDGNGALSHLELQQLVSAIPGLSASEQKYILVYLYSNADSRGGKLSFDALTEVVKAAKSKPPPAAAAAAASTGAAAAAAPALLQPRYALPPSIVGGGGGGGGGNLMRGSAGHMMPPPKPPQPLLQPPLPQPGMSSAPPQQSASQPPLLPATVGMLAPQPSYAQAVAGVTPPAAAVTPPMQSAFAPAAAYPTSSAASPSYSSQSPNIAQQAQFGQPGSSAGPAYASSGMPIPAARSQAATTPSIQPQQQNSAPSQQPFGATPMPTSLPTAGISSAGPGSLAPVSQAAIPTPFGMPAPLPARLAPLGGSALTIDNLLPRGGPLQPLRGAL